MVEYQENPQLKNELLDRLRVKYGGVRPEYPHLSDLLGCLTKSYYNQKQFINNTEQELLYFSIGFGLEKVILRDEEPDEEYNCLIANSPPMVQLDGVYLTPDYVATAGGQLDLKSTRMYADKDTGQPKRGFPDTWMEQFMGYAWLEHVQKVELDENGLHDLESYSSTGFTGALPESLTYSVGVVYLIPAQLEAGTFTFPMADVLENWNRVQMRKTIFMAHMGMDTPPDPFTYNKDWECKGCKYILRCEDIARQK